MALDGRESSKCAARVYCEGGMLKKIYAHLCLHFVFRVTSSRQSLIEGLMDSGKKTRVEA